MLVVWLRKQIIMQKLMKLKKNVFDRNHDKYITTPELNKFAEEVFDARLARVNLVTKADFDTKLISLNKKNNVNKKNNIYLLKINLKN